VLILNGLNNCSNTHHGNCVVLQCNVVPWDVMGNLINVSMASHFYYIKIVANIAYLLCVYELTKYIYKYR